ncbi:MAG: DUF1311 domain-containing protein [Spirochaetes bacterium]|nr:DUF1311 domain-containing protein [Spirochaetota bacterium]
MERNMKRNHHEDYRVALRQVQEIWASKLAHVYHDLVDVMTEVEKENLIASQKAWAQHKREEIEALQSFFSKGSYVSSSPYYLEYAKITLLKSRVSFLKEYLKSH